MKGITVFLCAVLILIGAVTANAIPITPVGVVATSDFGAPYSPEALIDGSGLTGGLHDKFFPDPPPTMWLSENSNWGTLTFDLGGVYSITSADIWQYNNKAFLFRGVNEFEITSSSDNGTTFGNATLATLEIAPPSPPDAIWAQNVAFSAADISHVRFEILSIHTSAQTFSGLSEVKFNTANAVPEPATLLLLGVGLVGLAGFGRKKLIKYK